VNRSVIVSLWLVMILGCLTTASCANAPNDEWSVERVVMLMRHGVRPPTGSPPVPSDVVPEAWPRWDVPLGHLTSHGAAAVKLLAASDARRFVGQGLLPASGCPSPGAVLVKSNSKQRTIATAENYASMLAPNCALTVEHVPEGVKDPMFASYADAGLSAAAAQQAVADEMGPQGIDGVVQRSRPGFEAVASMVCGSSDKACAPNEIPSTVVINKTGSEMPDFSGALEYGADIASVVMLEYAEGKPMSEVGWGRATPETIEKAGALHAAKYALIARPRPLAFANSGKIVDRMVQSLYDGPRVTTLVGHDDQIINVAGLLDVHWHVPGIAADDVGPAGAIVFEALGNKAGDKAVRSYYRSQTLDQIRTLSDGDATWVELSPPGCAGQSPCPLGTFAALLSPP